MNTAILFHTTAGGIFCALLLMVILAIAFALSKAPKFFRVWRALKSAPAPFRFSFGQKLAIASNSILPEWMGNHTRQFIGDSTLTNSWMVVKAGSTTGTITCVAATSDKPLGICFESYSSAYPTKPITVFLFGAQKGLLPAAISATLNEGDGAYSNGAGGVMPEPTATPGLYWRLGTSATKETTAGQWLAIACGPPTPVLLLAFQTFTAVATTAPTNSSPYGFTSAQGAALIAGVNALITAFQTLIAGAVKPGEIKYLQS